MGAAGFLYRWRGWVPVPAILWAVLASRPSILSIALGGALVAAGEALRLWASAHLGRTARSSRPRAARLVTTGPYARTRHPLYVANFLLTLGFLVLAAPRPFAVIPVLLVLFVALYARHAGTEEATLGAAFPDAWRRYAAAVPRWRWNVRPAAVPGAGENAPATLRRALGVEALTLNAEVWLLVAVWLRHRLV